MSTIFSRQDVHPLSSLSRNHALNFFSDWPLYNFIDKETEESTVHKSLTSPLSVRDSALSFDLLGPNTKAQVITVLAELLLL